MRRAGGRGGSRSPRTLLVGQEGMGWHRGPWCTCTLRCWGGSVGRRAAAGPLAPQHASRHHPGQPLGHFCLSKQFCVYLCTCSSSLKSWPNTQRGFCSSLWLLAPTPPVAGRCRGGDAAPAGCLGGALASPREQSPPSGWRRRRSRVSVVAGAGYVPERAERDESARAGVQGGRHG